MPDVDLVPAFTGDSAVSSGALAQLAAIGYCEFAVRDRLGLADLADLQMRALPIYRSERLGGRDALDCAIDLFLLQGALSETELDRVLGAAEQEALFRAGVLERRGGFVRTLVSLYPVDSTPVFSDHAWPMLDHDEYFPTPHDQVMSVGTDSRWLARTTVRKPVAAALDLCCGSGIHALLAASHAQRATAVDINPRAVRCTAFNARALGLANLEALEGDLYAPVGERRFGLITANPPFVPAPAQAMGFRDGGRSGEDVQRRIVEGLPRHLAPGGIAQIVTELGERDGEPLELRLREWLGGAAMDIHVLRLRVHSAQAYAIGHAEGEGHAAFLDSVGRWAANLADQGYERMVSVLLAFQWSNAPWLRVDEARAPARNAGAELEALLVAERLARDPALRARLRSGAVERTGAIAILEASALGAEVPPRTQAHLVGAALVVDHGLDSVEHSVLASMDAPVPVADFLAAAEHADVTGEEVLDALVSLVRKGFVRLPG